MAHFIGSNLRTDNWGEDYVIQECIEHFDDTCIIYRNRDFFGTQFDICVLLPNQGIAVIAVIEVKAWHPNKIHLSTMMSVLKRCLQNSDNVERLRKMQTGTPQFMFVDEFQDTDDVQIDALKRIAELLQYKLFVVGDIKQCIYRFRGAKEKAIDQLHIDEAKDQWLKFSLTKNFRTDTKLLDLFDKS